MFYIFNLIFLLIYWFLKTSFRAIRYFTC